MSTKLNVIGSNQTEVLKGDGSIVFFSYNTPVAVYIPQTKEVLVTEEKYSTTTTRHINSWLKRSPVVFGEVRYHKQEIIDSWTN